MRSERPGENPVRLFLIKAFYRVMRRIAEVDITPDVDDFRWLGFGHAEVHYTRAERYDGVTAFSNLPLKLVAYLGFAVFGLSIVLVRYGLLGRMFGGETPAGWASVFVAVAFLSGIQLVALGILGAYVSRIFDEVKGRPLYVIATDPAQHPKT